MFEFAKHLEICLAALPSLGNAKGKLLPRNSVAVHELPKIPAPAESLFSVLQHNKANSELMAVFYTAGLIPTSEPWKRGGQSSSKSSKPSEHERRILPLKDPLLPLSD